jgi:hypothetical protein
MYGHLDKRRIHMPKKYVLDVTQTNKMVENKLPQVPIRFLKVHQNYQYWT